MAGVIISRDPTLKSDQLIADLCAIYQNKSEQEIEDQLAKLYFNDAPGQIPSPALDEFIPKDKEVIDFEDIKPSLLKIDQLVEMAG